MTSVPFVHPVCRPAHADGSQAASHFDGRHRFLALCLTILVLDSIAVQGMAGISRDRTLPQPMIPGGSTQPKDFALVHQPELGIYHLFYIRQDQAVLGSSGRVDIGRTEKSLGHAWSPDLATWHPMPDVLPVRQDRWDNHHIWAPSILRAGDTYYLFYTGVQITSRGTAIQRIGVATADATFGTDSLKTWKRADSWIYSHEDVPWACQDTSLVAGRQFRDAFVEQDPERSGEYRMHYVTVSATQPRHYVVGVAYSDGGLHRWKDAGWLKLPVAAALPGVRIESPHVIRRGTSDSWLVFTLEGGLDPRSAGLQVAKRQAAFAADTSEGAWAPAVPLGAFLGQPASLSRWRASEWFSEAGRNFLAAYDDSLRGIDIREVEWSGRPPRLRVVHPRQGGPEPPLEAGRRPRAAR